MKVQDVAAEYRGSAGSDSRQELKTWLLTLKTASVKHRIVAAEAAGKGADEAGMPRDEDGNTGDDNGVCMGCGG